MILPFVRCVALSLVASGLFAVSSGCASSPDAKETVGSMSDFGVALAKVKDSIDDTVKSLEAVLGTQPDDLEKNFGAYSSSVKALEKQAKVVRDRANAMKLAGNEFFKEWEGSENVSKERRAELSASYAKIKEEMAGAKEEFVPFLNSAKDIESYLEMDLSLKGVNAAGDPVKRAKESSVRVKSRIDAVLTQLNSVRGMLSTKKS